MTSPGMPGCLLPIRPGRGFGLQAESRDYILKINNKNIFYNLGRFMKKRGEFIHREGLFGKVSLFRYRGVGRLDLLLIGGEAAQCFWVWCSSGNLT